MRRCRPRAILGGGEALNTDRRDQRTECIISTVTDPTQLYTFRIKNDTTIRSSLTLRLPVQAQILPEINAEYRLQYLLASLLCEFCSFVLSFVFFSLMILYLARLTPFLLGQLGDNSTQRGRTELTNHTVLFMQVRVHLRKFNQYLSSISNSVP